MEQAGKNTILLVRGTAAEPVGLSAFAAAQRNSVLLRGRRRAQRISPYKLI